MVRFIFICMGVVALSMVSIGMQFMTDGIGQEQADIAARNAPAQEIALAVEASSQTDEEISPEELSRIESAAGDTADAGFGQGFTNTAPKALHEQADVVEFPAEDLSQDRQN